MTFITLFWTFARIGLCTLGGGAATIPLLMELPGRFGWVTPESLAAIIALGESAPGPGGVNMAGCIGHAAAGLGGTLCAVAGLCLPSVIIVTAIALFVHGMQNSRYIKQFFYCLRPAVTAAIAVAVLSLMGVMLVRGHTVYGRAAALYLAGMVVTHLPQCRKVHLFVWIVCAGFLGALFQF